MKPKGQSREHAASAQRGGGGGGGKNRGGGGSGSRPTNRNRGSKDPNLSGSGIPGAEAQEKGNKLPALPEQFSGLMGDKLVSSVAMRYERGKSARIEVEVYGHTDDFEIDITLDKSVMSYPDFLAMREKIRGRREVRDMRLRVEQQLKLLNIDTSQGSAKKYEPTFEDLASYNSWTRALTPLELNVLTSTTSRFQAYFGLAGESGVGIAEAMERRRHASESFPGIWEVYGQFGYSGYYPKGQEETQGSRTLNPLGGSSLPRVVEKDIDDEEIVSGFSSGEICEEREDDARDWQSLDRPVYGKAFLLRGRFVIFRHEKRCYQRMSPAYTERLRGQGLRCPRLGDEADDDQSSLGSAGGGGFASFILPTGSK